MVRNLHGKLLEIEDTIEKAAADVDTDKNGDITLTFTGLRKIRDEASVVVSPEGGYVGNVQSISENQAVVRIYQSKGSEAALAPVTNGTDLCILHARAIGM